MSPRLIRRTTIVLPVTTSPPAFVKETGGVVQVLASDETNRGAVYIALDDDGAITWSARVPHLSVVSASACGGEIIATGVHEIEGVRWAMRLGKEGVVRWETPLPLPSSGLVWVVPTCIVGHPTIVWEAETETEGELGIATVGVDGLGRAMTSLQPGVAYGLHVATIDANLFVLRSRGTEIRGDILRIEDGLVVGRTETSKNAQALAVVGDRLAVLSWTQEALLLQWLNSSLTQLGDPETIATVKPPSWIRFATLHAAGEERIAVSYLVGALGDSIQMPGGRSEPGEYTRHFLGQYDADSKALGDVTEVIPTGTAWIAGAWLGDRLFFVHGATSAALSIYELDRDASSAGIESALP